jgi:hypothetical protein
MLRDFKIENTSAGAIGIDFARTLSSTITRVSSRAETPLSLGGGGCDCYNNFFDNEFVPPPALGFVGWGVKLGVNANDNGFHAGKYGAKGNATILAAAGSFNNNFSQPAMESIDLPFFTTGNALGVHDPYFEANGVIANMQAWQANFSYTVGRVIKDSNGNAQVCTADGLSDVAHPVWGTNLKDITAEAGTLRWTLYQLAGGHTDVVIAGVSEGNVIDGGGIANMIDLTAIPFGKAASKTNLVYQGPPYASGEYGMLFGPDPSNSSPNWNNLFLGYDSYLTSLGVGNYEWGLDVGFNPTSFACATYGRCGAAQLHTGELGSTGGQRFWGPMLALAIPAPAAPTVLSFTPGANATSYALVAHCNNGVTTVGAFSAPVNVTGPDGGNPVTIQLPATFGTPYAISTENWAGTCTYDILRNDATHTVALATRAPSRVFTDTVVVSTPGYVAPGRNTTGDWNVAGIITSNGKEVATASGATVIHGFCSGIAAPSTTIYPLGLGGSLLTCTDTTNNLPILMPSAGTLRNLYVRSSAGGVNASSGVVTIVSVVGGGTPITCTLGAGTDCNDTTHAYAAAAGERMVIAVTTQALETLADITVSFEKW